MKKNLLLTYLLFFGLFSFQNSRLTGQSVTIDMDSVHQTIAGFGGMNNFDWMIDDLTEDQRITAFSNEPGQLGLSILRVRINPDSNLFYREVPTALYATEQGAKVFGTPWNPPAYMLDAASEQKRLHPDYYDEYAQHLNKFYTLMNNSGVPLYAISVQNEPDYADEEGWTEWTAEEMITFLEENAADIDTRVMAPESFQHRREFSDSILNDPEASANLDILGAHIYGTSVEDYPYPLAHEKDKELWMTEHYTSSDRSANLWPDALEVGTEISECMKANFNAYVWWYIRRFYGLITEDGLISKRGYVMSHFSKFVRPGSERIDVKVSSAPNVDVTAYKTDTSCIIVVINKGNESVNIDFAVLDGTIDTLTKVTTSASKNVVNEGGVSLSGGTFSASIDAQSITTFTTHADNVASYGNELPVADADSDDLTITDDDGNGVDTLFFNGANSYDPDGDTVEFTWVFDGVLVSNDTALELQVDIGEHQVILTVKDNEGAVNSDTVNIILNTIFDTEIWFDAECAQVGDTWEILTDNDASNEKYVAAPAGTERIDSASIDTTDLVIVRFHISEPGPYKVWGRVITPTANDDSYWVSMDTSSTWAAWNSIPADNDWHWDDVHNWSDDSPVVYELDTGYHSLNICFREDGALLDKLYLTNMGLTPDGIGETDTTCPADEPEFIQSVKESSEIILYPNPASNEIYINWSEGYTSMRLIGIDGKIVIQKKYAMRRQDTLLDLNVEPGIYLLILRNEKDTSVTRFVVK